MRDARSRRRPLENPAPRKRFVVAAFAATTTVPARYPALGARAERGAKFLKRAFARGEGDSAPDADGDARHNASRPKPPHGRRSLRAPHSPASMR